MKAVDFIKGVYRRMFPIKNLNEALKISPAISPEMMKRIDFWHKCYIGSAPWIEDDTVSLRLENSIVREFAFVALNEMTLNVSLEKLDKLLKAAIDDINPKMQRGLALGGFIIKPLENNEVQYVFANEFIPIEYDVRGRLRKVIFPEFKKIGKNYYTRLEYHKLDAAGLTITNQAFVSTSSDMLGRRIPLDQVDGWEEISAGTVFPGMTRMAFGYYRNPLDNTVDGSACGISVFDNAIEVVKRADLQFGRLDYEFESARRRIHADMKLVKSPKSLTNIDELDRLYVDVNGDDDAFFKEFSPALRQEGFIAGLEEYKREIEFAVGLSYGDLSNPQYVEKTATEVNASKIRKRDTVDQIQKQIKVCLDDLVFALAFYNKMTKSGYAFACDFKDSILNDEASEREEDRKDLANGTLRPEEYRAKWRNESLDKAKKNLPNTAEVED